MLFKNATLWNAVVSQEALWDLPALLTTVLPVLSTVLSPSRCFSSSKLWNRTRAHISKRGILSKKLGILVTFLSGTPRNGRFFLNCHPEFPGVPEAPSSLRARASTRSCLGPALGSTEFLGLVQWTQESARPTSQLKSAVVGRRELWVSCLARLVLLASSCPLWAV